MCSPRNEVFQAIPFDGATSDAEEPMIATGGNAEEEEDQQGRRLEERTFARLFLASLLFGWLMGFFFSMVTADLQVGANCLVVYFEMKSNTDLIVFILLWSLFTLVAPLVLILVLISSCNLGGRSELGLLEADTAFLWYMGGAAAGICLACTTMDVLLGTRGARVGYPCLCDYTR
jgi:hypothetical protein